ncbi:MAG: cation diffusion facilitator family transporter [Candidatus Xenobiia bacterium LiM19]
MSDDYDDASDNVDALLKKGRTVAAFSAVILLLLIITKAIVGYISNSSAILAEAFHSAGDILTILAAWIGLKVASRKPDEQFPYGYYKAENLAGLTVSFIISLIGIGLLKEGTERLLVLPEIKHVPMALCTMALSSIVSVVLAIWELRIGKKINSQVLIVHGQELYIDAFTSFSVFISVILSGLKIPFIEGAITIIISIMMLSMGIKSIRISILALMDANPNPKLIENIKEVILAIEDIKQTELILLRQAGPFYFGECRIKVSPSVNIMSAHEISHMATLKVQQKYPRIATFTVHIEPYVPTKRKVMIPSNEDRGFDSEISEHFGRAPYFIMAYLEGSSIQSIDIRENLHYQKELHAGLNLVKDLIKRYAPDAIITRSIGEIGFHTLKSNLIEVYLAEDTRVKDALEKFTGQKLEQLSSPTHSCDNEKGS